MRIIKLNKKDIKTNFDEFKYFITKISGTSILKVYNLLISLFTKNYSIYPNDDFHFVKLLSENYETILSEYNSVVKANKLRNSGDFYKVNTDIGQHENWFCFPFSIYNYPFEQNLAFCPNTSEVLRKIPECTSAMFSILGPGKYVLPHNGIYKGVIRCLFTLKADENGKCWIRVGNQKFKFLNGNAVVFDETFEHEVHNDSEMERVVLYMDIYRELPFPLNLINKFIFNLIRNSVFVNRIIKN